MDFLRSRSEESLPPAFRSSPASRVEAELEERTHAILQERARLRKDNAFLQHFAEAAQRSAVERWAFADATSQALGEQTVQQTSLESALQALKAELASEQAAFHATRDVYWKTEVRLAQHRRDVQGELAGLGQRLAVEAQGHQRAVQDVASLAQALEVTRREVAAEVQVVQHRRREADKAVADVEEVRREAGTREALVTRVLHDTLARLEADFARERAERDAQEARVTKRSQEHGASLPSSPILQSLAGDSGKASIEMPAAVRTELLSDIRRSLASAAANTNAAAAVAAPIATTSAPRAQSDLNKVLVDLGRGRATLQALAEDNSGKSS